MQDISDWEREEENRGSRDGVWVRHPRSRRRGLAKFSKVLHVEGKPFECAEAGAEVLASYVGELLGLPVPQVDVVRLDGRISCLSWSFVEPGYQLREGVDLFGASQDDRRISVEEARDVLAEYLGREEATQHVINLVCFDILIGNPDRHLANWGVLIPAQPSSPYQMAPYYDNGSAFGSNLDPVQVTAHLASSEKQARFDRRFKYEMTVGGSRKARLDELLEMLLQWDRGLAGFPDRLQKLTEEAVGEMLGRLDSDVMTVERRAFARQLLFRRSERIRKAVVEYAS